MLHTRKQIIENQTQYREEITKSLKEEFTELKKELRKLKTEDPTILSHKKKLLEKSQQVNITKEINKLFISWKNIYPNFYAWWDESGQQVLKLKYDDK